MENIGWFLPFQMFSALWDHFIEFTMSTHNHNACSARFFKHTSKSFLFGGGDTQENRIEDGSH